MKIEGTRAAQNPYIQYSTWQRIVGLVYNHKVKMQSRSKNKTLGNKKRLMNYNNGCFAQIFLKLKHQHNINTYKS